MRQVAMLVFSSCMALSLQASERTASYPITLAGDLQYVVEGLQLYASVPSLTLTIQDSTDDYTLTLPKDYSNLTLHLQKTGEDITSTTGTCLNLYHSGYTSVIGTNSADPSSNALCPGTSYESEYLDLGSLSQGEYMLSGLENGYGVQLKSNGTEITQEVSLALFSHRDEFAFTTEQEHTGLEFSIEASGGGMLANAWIPGKESALFEFEAGSLLIDTLSAGSHRFMFYSLPSPSTTEEITEDLSRPNIPVEGGTADIALSLSASDSTTGATVQDIGINFRPGSGSEESTRFLIAKEMSLKEEEDAFVGTLSTPFGATLTLRARFDGRSTLTLERLGRSKEITLPRGFESTIRRDGTFSTKAQSTKYLVWLDLGAIGSGNALIKQKAQGGKIFRLRTPRDANSASMRLTDQSGATRALSDDAFYAISSRFESDRAFTITTRTEGTEQQIVVTPSEESTFEESITVEGDHTLTLISGSATIDQTGETQSMVPESVVSLPADEAEAGELETVFAEGSLTLHEGWNLIALPENSAKSSSILGDNPFWRYDGSSWSQPQNISPKEALWVRAPSTLSIPFEGYGYDLTQSDLAGSGWQMVGLGADIKNPTSTLGVSQSWKYLKGAWYQDPAAAFRGQGLWVKP